MTALRQNERVPAGHSPYSREKRLLRGGFNFEDDARVDDAQSLALLVEHDRVGVALGDLVREVADQLREPADG